MITRRICLTLAALAGMGLTIGRGAGAQSIVQTFTIPSNSPVPITDTFTFNLFNPGLGQLNAITIAFATTITAEVDVYNFNAGPEPFSNATASIPVTLTAPDAITITATGVAGPISGTVNPGETPFTGLPASANDSVSLPTGDFSFYETPPGAATGTVTVSSTSGTYAGTAGANMAFGGNATVDGSVTITYFYQQAGTIPEPGATTFLAAGVLGSLGMVIRRRKK